MKRIYCTRRALLAGALALFATSTSASAQEKKVDVTGKWMFTVTTDAGTGTPSVTMKQSGDTLSGHYSSQAFGEVDFKGTVKDKTITFSFNADVQGTQFKVTYTGTLDGADAIKGTVDLGGMGSGTFTGRRVDGSTTAR